MHRQAVISQNNVSACHRNVLDEEIVDASGNHERKRERILLGPVDLVKRGAIERILDLSHAGEPQRPAPVCPPFQRAPRIANLLQDQDHAGFQCSPQGPSQSGGTRALAKCTFVVRPGVELKAVVSGAHRQWLHRFEDGGSIGIEAVEISRPGQSQLVIASGEELRANPEQDAVCCASRFHIHLHPDARVATFVHAIVAQPRMAPQRDAVQRGPGIRFGRGGVLSVRNLVADIREELGDRDGKISARRLRPSGHEEAKTVEKHATEALVVAGKIVDARRGRWFARTG